MRVALTSAVLFVGALAVRLVLFWRSVLVGIGVRTPPDTGTYLSVCAEAASDPTALLTGKVGIEYLGFTVPFCTVNAIAGGSLVPWAVIQVLLSSIAVVLLYWTGRNLYSGRAGLVAAVLFMLLYDGFRWTTIALSDMTFVFAITVAMYALSLWYKKKTPRRRLGLYSALTFVAITRPVGFPLVAGWILWDLLPERSELRPSIIAHRWVVALVFGVGLGGLLFVSSREQWISDHMTSVWQNGWVFWSGNSPLPWVEYPFEVAFGPGPLDAVVGIVHLFLLGLVKVALLFWPLPPQFLESPFWTGIHLVSFVPLVLFGIAGVGAMIRRRDRSVAIVATPVLVTVAIVGVTFIDVAWRYRAPLEPGLALAVGYVVSTTRLDAGVDRVLRMAYRVLGVPTLDESDQLRPDQDALATVERRYDRADLTETAIPSYTNSLHAVREVFLARLGIIDEFIDLRDPEEVIDVGCGPGVTLAGISDSEARAVGLDLDTRFAAAYLEETGSDANLIRGDLMSLPLASKSTSCIVAADAIEHVSDLDAAISEFDRVVSQGGIVVVSGPTENRLYRLGRTITGYREPSHHRSIRAIRTRFESAGWTHVDGKTVGAVPLFEVHAFEV